MESVPFGKYEVLCRLAKGGAASIYLARQPGVAGFKKLVCIKTLLPQRASDDDFVAMFLDEARLAALLNHPNCVQIFDLGRVNGVYFISMEYIFGETLWSLLTTVSRSRAPLPPADVAWMIANASQGLHHAHELRDAQGRLYNLVHRDVSPQNIMITFEGQTKLLDFGVAKAETGRAATTAGIVKGKFSYMSPEQITGATVDRRSDVFSLGIVLFECLASRRLYRADTPEAIASLILDHHPPRLKDVVPDIDPRLDAICHRALASSVSERFQTAQEMGDALRDYLGDIRYTQGTHRIASLLQDRFSSVIEGRRRAINEALHEGSDQVIRALGAEPAHPEDFLAEEEELPDFSEETRNEGLAPLPSPHLKALAIPPPPSFSEDENRTDDVAIIRIPESQRGDTGDLDEAPTAALPQEASTFVETVEGEHGTRAQEPIVEGRSAAADPSESFSFPALPRTPGRFGGDDGDGLEDSDRTFATVAELEASGTEDGLDAGTRSDAALQPAPQWWMKANAGAAAFDDTRGTQDRLGVPLDELDTPEQESSGRSLQSDMGGAVALGERSPTAREPPPTPSSKLRSKPVIEFRVPQTERQRPQSNEDGDEVRDDPRALEGPGDEPTQLSRRFPGTEPASDPSSSGKDPTGRLWLVLTLGISLGLVMGMVLGVLMTR